MEIVSVFLCTRIHRPNPSLWNYKKLAMLLAKDGTSTYMASHAKGGMTPVIKGPHNLLYRSYGVSVIKDSKQPHSTKKKQMLATTTDMDTPSSWNSLRHKHTKPEVFHRRAGFDHPKQPLSRPMSKSSATTCCMRNPAGKRNYYELLGISVGSDPQEIKESYRKLQKKYHPDIAGEEGHEHTILLNEAYNVLMRDDLRKDYDASIGHVRVRLGADELNMGYSSWNGPFRPQALFVDENACIGCRECVHNASKTFVMDETTGCARVSVQFGDNDASIQVAVESCPLDCIHWVEREQLAVLEYLNTPRPKQGYGVFGQGWERPKNVFMAAKTFQKNLKQQQAESLRRKVRHDVEQETEAQAQARESASLKLKMERFAGLWEWMKK